jgi:hypothetical protein
MTPDELPIDLVLHTPGEPGQRRPSVQFIPVPYHRPKDDQPRRPGV